MNPTEARRRLVETFTRTHSVSETARRWHTSRQVVRKWLRRYKAQGLAGLADASRAPHRSPAQTDPASEQKVLALRKNTGYGRKRLAWHLARQHKLMLSPYTIRHILRRHGYGGKTRPRKPLYPAHWAWAVKRPFTLMQVDTKDILDRGTLGSRRWNHIIRRRLPRYQWTCLEARTRLRFLAYSHELSQANGIAFMVLVMLHLRAHGIKGRVGWQTDWGSEFGGSDLARIAGLQEKYYDTLGAVLCRYPKGRKGYNGRVERSHRTDDEEFYLPCLEEITDDAVQLRYAAAWLSFYNLERPHQGVGMKGEPPFVRLRQLGYPQLPSRFALLPPVLLDTISADVAVEEGGNDLLAPYTTDAPGERSPGRCRRTPHVRSGGGSGRPAGRAGG